MTTYISMLRGINVGGHKKIKMDALRLMFTEMGFENVQSYIQSGNIIFRANRTDSIWLSNSISKQILSTFGFDVQAVIITVNELEEILTNNEFSLDPEKNPENSYYIFLQAKPDQSLLKNIVPAEYTPDEFSFRDKVIYVYCASGYGNTKLTNLFFEKKLKIFATARNHGTTTKLLTMAKEL